MFLQSRSQSTFAPTASEFEEEKLLLCSQPAKRKPRQTLSPKLYPVRRESFFSSKERADDRASREADVLLIRARASLRPSIQRVGVNSSAVAKRGDKHFSAQSDCASQDLVKAELTFVLPTPKFQKRLPAIPLVAMPTSSASQLVMVSASLSSSSSSSLSSSSFSSSTDGERSSSSHPLCFSQVGSGGLSHQDSSRFSDPNPWRRPSRRSESQRSDSLTEGGSARSSSSSDVHMHSDGFSGDEISKSSIDNDVHHSDVFAENPKVGKASVEVSETGSPHSSRSRALNRSFSRRRSYSKATADSIAPTSAAGVVEREIAVADGDDEDDERVDVEDVSEEEEKEDGSPSMTPPSSRRSAKSRRVDRDSFDPYQIFEVQHVPCLIFTVTVIRGRNITNGWAHDLVDTPDPYVKLRLPTAPEGRQRTRTISNNANPVWNETFTFFLGFSENNVLELTLMEENPVLDQETGKIYFNIYDRMKEFGQWQTEIFNFNGYSEVDVAFHMEWDQNPTLRYSLCLSDQEKEFMRKRKEKVWLALNTLLGEKGPQTLEETPTIAVIGSGGGFRAMTGYSGAFKALADTGLLDCVTYACGLSGSSWYLSTLYSHPRWPDLNPGELQQELMGLIDTSPVRLLGPENLCRYVGSIMDKWRQGQPVSFTDFFGHMVGDTLLKGRMESRLTDQREKIEDGHVPMPLYTCVHVKEDIPARSFQEWVEFSPYEIGMPKYGTFMDTKYFGSKFYMGKLVKAYEELPLHFLQGIWGSAFSILFKRLLEDNQTLDPAQMIHCEMELGDDMGDRLPHRQDINDSSSSSSDLSDDNDEDETNDMDKESSSGRRRRSSTALVPGTPRRTDSPTDSSERDTTSDDGESSSDGDHIHPPRAYRARGDSSSEGFDDLDSSNREAFRSPIRRTSDDACSCPRGGDVKDGTILSNSPEGPKKGVRFSRQVDKLEKRKAKQKRRQRRALLKRTPSARCGKSCSYWSSILKGIFESQSCEHLLNTRAVRAAVIHNFMRGLNLQRTYPISPFTPPCQRVQKGDDFDGIFEQYPTHIKRIYMVDAGLTFNSPYPLVLRPQRGVDVILSFDFSERESDSTPPFKELLLAEKWARINRLPFPPIDPSVAEREGLKELYVFQDPDDPHCPVVLHFPLVNSHFRRFKAPGVPRQTEEEKDFADFDIFDDPAAPFKCWNFTYTAQNFRRLSQLTEFNTLLGLEEVKTILAQAVDKKRHATPPVPAWTRDFRLLRKKSEQERQQLKDFLSRVEGNLNARTPTPSQPSTPFFTPAPAEARREPNPFVFTRKGRNLCFNTFRQTWLTEVRRDGVRSPGRPRNPSSAKSPRRSGAGSRHLTSHRPSPKFASTSSTPLAPSPSRSCVSSGSAFPVSPSTTTPSPLRGSASHERPSRIGSLRQNSSGSLGPVRQRSEVSGHSSDEEFYDAGEALTRGGEVVTDPQRAKMYYERAKERRKLFRQQSMISTLNSITESIWLDSESPPQRNSLASSGGPLGIEVADLGQFEGIADEEHTTTPTTTTPPTAPPPSMTTWRSRRNSDPTPIAVR